MEVINEIELRNLLKRKLEPQELNAQLLKAALDPQLSWEEKRSYWFYLFLTGRKATVAHAMKQALTDKLKIPLDLFLQLTAECGVPPKSVVLDSLLKGLKKGNAFEAIFAVKGWDKWDKRFSEMRVQLIEQKVIEQRRHKENLVEKFWFLRNQRMVEQAGRVLRRLLELYPEDEEFVKLKADFDEQWARDVLANHAADLHNARMDRTATAPSSADEEMLRSFLASAEKLFVDNREAAADLAIAFLFLEDYPRALEVLAWAPPTAAADWLRLELMLFGRRHVEALDFLNQLEVKYIDDPETTFSVNYARAQCLQGLGQHASALEIMQSIVRVRANYRSAHALILEWTAGVSWE